MNLVKPTAGSLDDFLAGLAANDALIFKTSPLKNDDFSERLFTLARETFSRYGYLYAITSLKKYYSALEAIRAKNNCLYHVLVNEAVNAEETHHTLENKLILSCSSAIIAYQKYTALAFEEAANLLKQAFILDGELETAGFKILHFHKIQLMHNYARIYLKTNKPKAVALLTNLAALLGNNSQFSHHEFFIDYKNNSLSPALTGAMFTQICNEILLVLTAMPVNDDGYTLNQSTQLFLKIHHSLTRSALFCSTPYVQFSFVMDKLLKAPGINTLIKTASEIMDFLLLTDNSLLYYKIFILHTYRQLLAQFNYTGICRFDDALQALFTKYVYLNKGLFNLALQQLGNNVNGSLVLST